MDIHDEPDDLTNHGDVTVHRARAKAELAQIAQQAKQALAQHGIDLGLFFLIPNSGDAIITYGTPGDPPDDEWNRVGEIVGSIVAQSIGLDRVRCREVMCATTHSVADHQPQASSVQPTEPSGCRPALVPASALQQAGADSCDITSGDRFRLPASHPILSSLCIDPADWHDFQRLFDDDPAIRILDHATPRNGRMTVHVACASAETRSRLEDGWG